MPYLKTYVNISLDYPVYVKVPVGLEYDDIQELIESTSTAWAFADDDVVAAVKSALPIAEGVTPDVGASDDIYGSCPDGSLVYNIKKLSSEKAVSKFVVDKTIERLTEAAADAAYSNDADRLLEIADQIRAIAKGTK